MDELKVNSGQESYGVHSLTHCKNDLLWRGGGRITLLVKAPVHLSINFKTFPLKQWVVGQKCWYFFDEGGRMLTEFMGVERKGDGAIVGEVIEIEMQEQEIMCS